MDRSLLTVLGWGRSILEEKSYMDIAGSDTGVVDPNILYGHQ